MSLIILNDTPEQVAKTIIQLLKKEIPGYSFTMIVNQRGSGAVDIVSTESQNEAHNIIKEVGNHLRVNKTDA